MDKARPIVGISVGDPGGIGPEVTVKALAVPRVYEQCRPLVIGDASVVRDALRFTGLSLAVNAVDSPEKGVYKLGVVDVLDMGNMPIDQVQYGVVTAQQGRASFEYVAKNIELAMAHRMDATVTGPINKAAINEAGFHFAGHTEIYAKMTGTRDYAMMLAEGNFRVAHVSTHVSLREACDRVTRERVLRVIELSHDALLKLGVANPRIAVAGLNPHCGEGGLFGTEEEREIMPAIADAVAKGMNVTGPVPPDTVFSKMAGGMFDLVVVMYHDQGHIPLKIVDFMGGVNMTVGLPIIRTSVDHGTAFGRAGQGRADDTSLIAAIDAAILLAARRKTHPRAL